jgi:hypothetical protein
MPPGCPACRGPVAEGARFCPQCGAALALGKPEGGGDSLRETLEAAIGFQYRIVRLLGKGGMGAVYLAHELALDREVAIKVLPPDRSETSQARERFRREARTAARLTHPNIVPLLTFGELRGLVYYVMGFVRGESLAARLRRDGRMPAEETRRILGEIADALDHAHRQGVIHRDLKPDNVLLDEGSGRAMLADFGIAKTEGLGHTLTASGAIVGTPHYMSPEQAAGKSEVDARTDLYSLGVMGYEMLTGERPFDGRSAADVLVQHMTQPPPPLAPKAGGAPARLVAALERCLAKEPGQRFSEARALRQEITQDESAELPDDLRIVHAMPSVWLAYGVVMWFYGLYEWLVGDLIKGWERGPLYEALDRLWVLLLILSFVAVQQARKRRHSWAAIREAALRQPYWWRGYYPRRHRAPGDVWDRLPAPVRRARAVVFPGIALFWLLLATNTLLLVYSGERYAKTGTRVRWVGDWASHKAPLVATFGLVAAVFVSWVYGLIGARRRLKAAGAPADKDTVERALLVSTARRNFWSRPEIAPLLEVRTAAPAPTPVPGSPAQIETTLARLLNGWSGARSALAERVRAAAGQCRLTIDTLDRDLEALRRDHDPEEAKRLSARLLSLGEAAEDEPAERRTLRELLTRQLELSRGVEERLARAQADRERNLGTLRRLFELVATYDRSPQNAERLERICAELSSGYEQHTVTRTAGASAARASLGGE